MNVRDIPCEIDCAGDTTWCSRCRSQWDTNDPDAGRCPLSLPSKAAGWLSGNLAAIALWLEAWGW